MAHEVETMFSYEEVPWHGLGTITDHALTSEEAIDIAGLNWEVQTVSVVVNGSIVENYKAVQRVHDHKLYNIVRNRYEPIQNKEAFGFFDSVVGTKEAIFHTAGSLKEGARIWMLAKINGSMGVKGEQIDKFVCLTNSHDGYLALQMFWTPIRVVCANTLAMAESGASTRFYARHTKNYKARIEVAQEILGLSNKFYDGWLEEAKYLANHMLPEAQKPLMLLEAFGYNGSIAMEDIYNPVKVAMNKIEELVVVGKGMDNPAIKGTAWQAYNAVVEYVDYYRKARGGKPEGRLNQAWFGSGANIKERTWKYLLNNI